MRGLPDAGEEVVRAWVSEGEVEREEGLKAAAAGGPKVSSMQILLSSTRQVTAVICRALFSGVLTTTTYTESSLRGRLCTEVLRDRFTNNPTFALCR